MANIVFIPALKRDAAFQDDLLRKIDGKTLIQRAIDKAKDFNVTNSSIHIITDSEEVGLRGDRAGVRVFLDKSQGGICRITDSEFGRYCRDNVSSSDVILRLSPYAPLIEVSTLREGSLRLKESSVDVVVGATPIRVDKMIENTTDLENELLPVKAEKREVRSGAFAFIRGAAIRGDSKRKLEFSTVSAGIDIFEITSYQDWWVCEKLLSRKRIVFRVIGNQRVGMGHIFRALTLAHEIVDDEIIFVTDEESKDAVNRLTNYDYRLEVYNKRDIVYRIADLTPNLVINDILDTNKEDVILLQSRGVRVMNFEDLGEGATLADVTINELYDIPRFEGGNIRWGMDYFFVRDEFIDAKPCDFKEKPDAVLLSFGGVDQHDLTRKLLFTIADACRERDVHIFVVTGPGYGAYNELADQIEGMKGISLTHATGVISNIMEKVSLAITSNGRTVYEMAHMNIPALVIPQHERERTHMFASKDNGFIQFNPYKKNITESQVLESLVRMLDDSKYREGLYKKTLRYKFSENKQRVIDLIAQQLHES